MWGLSTCVSACRNEGCEEEGVAEGMETLPGAGLEEDGRDTMPPMSVSIDLEQLRSNWKRRQKQGGHGSDITSIKAASVKVITAQHGFSRDDSC